MRIRKTHGEEDRIELQMTPMIDIVFQLLIFFIMTFKIVAREGDFNVKMPAASPQQQTIEEPPPLDLSVQVFLEAGADGGLAGIKVTAFNQETAIEANSVSASFDELNDKIISIFASADSPGEVQDIFAQTSDGYIRLSILCK